MTSKKKKGRGGVQIGKMMAVFIFVSFVWIFFRTQSLSDVGYVIRYTFFGVHHPLQYLKTGYYDIGMNKKELFRCISMIGLLGIYDAFSLKFDVIEHIGRLEKGLRWLLYFVVILLILFWAPIGNESSFIYFQF